MDAILVANAGSSSLKFQVFDIHGGRLERLVRGQVDGIGSRPRMAATDSKGAVLVDERHAASVLADLPSAIHLAASWLRETQSVNLVAVGHRVVHGGPDYALPVMVDAAVLARLERFVPLAPLHQPNNLAPIRALMARRPDLPQIACFDTGFHHGRDPVTDHYAMPEAFYREGVRRYGFHGISYEYVTGRMRELAPDIAKGRMIVAHLGSGASMCAISNGRSIESTLGFTALDGLPMGTRPGQIDPGVVLYLIAAKGMSPAATQDFLYRECGLKGLSGVSNDMRELEASDDPQAAFAIAHFVYRAGLQAGMLAAAMGGVEALVFTAGIGEHSASIRAAIAQRMEWLGARLDPDANAAHRTVISPPGSPLALYVVPTDEECMIARHTLGLLKSSVPAGRREAS